MLVDVRLLVVLDLLWLERLGQLTLNQVFTVGDVVLDSVEKFDKDKVSGTVSFEIDYEDLLLRQCSAKLFNELAVGIVCLLESFLLVFEHRLHVGLLGVSLIGSLFLCVLVLFPLDHLRFLLFS